MLQQVSPCLDETAVEAELGNRVFRSRQKHVFLPFGCMLFPKFFLLSTSDE